MPDAGNVHILDNPAQILAAQIVALAKRNGGANLAFAGGPNCEAVCLQLATTFDADMPWARVMFFQVDEIGVAADHDDAHWRVLRNTILVAHPDVRAFPMDARAPDAAQDYEHVLMNMLPFDHHGTPVLDVVVLELGHQGTVASMPEGSAARREQHEPVAAVPGMGESPCRLTLTMPTLNAANNRFLIATEEEKAGVVRECLDGRHSAGQLKSAEWFLSTSLGAAIESAEGK